MFPNIDNKLGLTAVRKALNARENKFPPTTCILEAVKICLKSNHSVFKGATSWITQLEKAGKFFQVCHS